MKYIQISALQHYGFCERQYYLIYLENIWEENLYTSQGNNIHSNVDSGNIRKKNGSVYYGNILVSSSNHGIYGIVDEIKHMGIEYIPRDFKRGCKKIANCDRVQVCGYALCLEEMLNVQIKYGEIYYGKSRRKEIFEISDDIKQETIEVINKIRNNEFDINKPSNKSKCKNCSLYTRCLPKINEQLIKRYIG